MATKRKTPNVLASKTTVTPVKSTAVQAAGHVVELHRDAERKWYWTRRSSNGVIVAESHRLWPRRGDAERNLQAVNAQPFRLVDTTQETNV